MELLSILAISLPVRPNCCELTLLRFSALSLSLSLFHSFHSLVIISKMILQTSSRQFLRKASALSGFFVASSAGPKKLHSRRFSHFLGWKTEPKGQPSARLWFLINRFPIVLSACSFDGFLFHRSCSLRGFHWSCSQRGSTRKHDVGVLTSSIYHHRVFRCTINAMRYTQNIPMNDLVDTRGRSNHFTLGHF
jgi:hypothetical protein